MDSSQVFLQSQNLKWSIGMKDTHLSEMIINMNDIHLFRPEIPL